MVSAAADRGIISFRTTISLRLCVFARRKKYGRQKRQEAKYAAAEGIKINFLNNERKAPFPFRNYP